MDDKKIPILIVDDDVHLRRTIGDVLSLKGFIPFTAENGRQALDQIQQTGNMVVALIDLRLEGMNGLQLLKNIKSVSPDTECILFTGYASQESVIEAINLGAFSYIQKPFDMELLLVTIQRAVEKNIDKTMLRENEKRFRGLYENAALGIYRVTPDGQILLANPALVEMLGYDSFEELVKQNLGKPVYADGYSRADFQQQLERDWLVRGYEVGYHRKDGSIIFVRESARVIRDENGRSLYYEGTMEDITERRQAELALKASEASYRMLAENMTDTVWLMDMNLRISYISPSVTRLRGYTLEELNTLPYEQQMTPDSLSRLMQLMAGALSPENIENPNLPISRKVELEFYRKDGSSFWSENEFIVIRDPEGRPKNILGTGRDITDRKLAEQLLRESEQKYRLLVDNASEAIVVAQDGILKFVNRMASDITGYSEQELTARPFPEFVHPDDRDMVIERYLRRIKGDMSQPRYAFRLKVRDGSIKWVEIDAVLIDWEGKPATLNFITDITERKRSEEALRASEEQLRLVTDNMLDMVVRTDLQGIFLYASPSHENVLGYEPASLLGTSIYDFMHPEDKDRVRNVVLSTLQAETPGKQEYRYRHADGHYMWLESIGTLIYGDNGSPIGAVFSTRNVTERKQAETKLNEQLEELRRWHQATLGREMRVLDLKREVNELLVKAGQPLRYPGAETESQ